MNNNTIVMIYSIVCNQHVYNKLTRCTHYARASHAPTDKMLYTNAVDTVHPVHKW